MNDDLRYPIGPQPASVSITDEARRSAIGDLAALPRHLRDAVAGLSERQIDTPYRPGGWTVRQLVHHVADSHMNAYIRLKLALTETTPTIKPYDEKLWATVPDSRLPIEVSLSLLDALHARWVAVLDSLDEAQFSRSFHHPELAETVTVDRQLQTYSWHSRHHTAHITSLRKREGW